MSRIARVFVWCSLLVGSAVFLLPFYWMAISSLKAPGAAGIYRIPPTLFAWPLHIENYPAALGALPFARYLSNTLVVTLGCIVGQVVSASLVGYGFARLRFRGRNALFILLLSTMMLPGQVTMIPLFLLFRALGWIDTFAPLVVPSFFGGSAFFVFLFRQFFLTIPRDLEEAARIDGCSQFEIWWRIFMPLSKPVIVTTVLFTFMSAWNDFLGPLIYLNSGENRTLAVGLLSFKDQYDRIEAHLLLAVSTLMMLPCLVLFFFGQKYFVKSVATTGLKG
ncbi:MAG: carbohydrate ABC transporter permease [Planctomycetes bacterium]|nr:carbohydrate ABC transporter permease [Planctomycetota bacterium]MBI3847001.1 carbohydrate ABC transporter permease [Planctomycetota bacterium]